MQRPALEFGGASVVRFYCDADGCSQPLGIRNGSTALAYRGLAGDYCSRACLLRCDPERVKLQAEKVTTVVQVETSPQKVSTGTRGKVKRVARVKTAPLEKVKTAPPKVQTRRTPASQSWKWQRTERRAAVQRIRQEFLDEGREPTIARVREQLLRIGFQASVRSVWQDLRSCREHS